MPSASSALSTPMWAKPRGPPEPRHQRDARRSAGGGLEAAAGARRAPRASPRQPASRHAAQARHREPAASSGQALRTLFCLGGASRLRAALVVEVGALARCSLLRVDAARGVRGSRGGAARLRAFCFARSARIACADLRSRSSRFGCRSKRLLAPLAGPELPARQGCRPSRARRCGSATFVAFIRHAGGSSP